MMPRRRALIGTAVLLLTSSTGAYAQSAAPARSPQALIEAFRGGTTEEKQAATTALFVRKSETAPALRGYLATGSRADRHFACLMLAELRDTGSVDALLVATHDADESVKAHAVSALRTIGDGRAAPRLREIMQAPTSTSVLKRAMVGLGKIGKPADARLLRRYLAHADEEVQVIAAGVMAMLGNGEGEDILLAATRSHNPAAQKDATVALGYLTSSDAKERIAAILADPDGAWRSYAAIAQSLQERSTRNPSQQAERLELLARGRDRIVATWAVDELSESTSAEAAAALNRLNRPSSRIGRRAQRRLLAKEGQ